MRLLPFDYAIRNLGRSPSRLVGILAGNTLVVALILAAASFVEGMRVSLGVGAPSRNVFLLGAGSEEALERSEISARVTGLVTASVPGIAMAGGVPFVSPEVLTAIMAKTGDDDTAERKAVVRGVTPTAFLVHSRVEIVEGRAPHSGTDELLVGDLAAVKLGLPPERLAPGQQLWFDDHPYTIVGRFRAEGTVMNAEIWMPLQVLLVATKRDTISCVTVTLDTAEFADLDAFAKTRLDLELTALEESRYYAGLNQFYRPVRIMIWATATLMALAGVLGGLNTLYAAFAARVREVAMLQSLGFSRGAVVASLVQESVLAASAAVLIGSLLTYLALDGIAIGFSMGVFELRVAGTALLSGAVAGLLLGFLGAIPPAWRCLRLPIAEGLKSI